MSTKAQGINSRRQGTNNQHKRKLHVRAIKKKSACEDALGRLCIQFEVVGSKAEGGAPSH